MFNLLDAVYAIDTFEPIAKWLAVGVVAAAVLAGIVVFFAKREIFAKFAKYAFFALFVFLLALGLACLVMEIAKHFSQAYADKNFLQLDKLTTFVLIPIACLVALLLVSAAAIAVTNLKSSDENKKKNTKLAATVCGAVCLAALVAAGVLMAIYYQQAISEDGYFNSDTASVNSTVLYICAAIVTVLIFASAFLFDRDKKSIDTRCIAMAGITIAMSFGLSYIKLFTLPQGGSVTLFSLLPVMVFSYVYGTKKGVFACFIYGVLQAVQDPWIIHPAQFLLDYPIAFAAIGLTGIFKNIKAFENLPQVSFLLGGILAGVLRFVSHVLSGVFAFSAYADGANPWIYSLGYNSFVFVDLVIVLAIGVLVFSSKAFVNELKKVSEK